jgi:hypothetical protein
MKKLYYWLIGSLITAGGILTPVAALAADSLIGVSVCTSLPQVSISLPVNGTQTTRASINVIGVADSGDSLSLIRNDNQVAATTVGPSGNFELSIPLVIGSNVLKAHVQNSCDIPADSSTVTIIRNTPPSPPGSSSFSDSSSGQGFGDIFTRYIPSTNPSATTNGNQAPLLSILYPPDGFSTGATSIEVSGNAPPGSEIHIYLNGIEQGWASVGNDGYYLLLVKLKTGANLITVKVANSNLSTSIKVTRLASSNSFGTGKKSNFWTTPHKIEVSIVVAVFITAVAVAGNIFPFLPAFIRRLLSKLFINS